MTKSLLFIFLFGGGARAGTFTLWWSNICQKHLIADDPYQFETATEIGLRREHYRYLLKIKNRCATNQDKRIFKMIEDELKRRGQP